MFDFAYFLIGIRAFSSRSLHNRVDIKIVIIHKNRKNNQIRLAFYSFLEYSIYAFVKLPVHIFFFQDSDFHSRFYTFACLIGNDGYAYRV